MFWTEEDTVIQFHPKKDSYINFHGGCLHLWQCLDKEQPLPSPIMVGPKRRSKYEARLPEEDAE